MKLIDFLPERVKQQRLRRKRLMRQAAMLVVCAGVLGASGYSGQTRLAQARDSLADRQSRVAAQQSQLQVLPALRQQQDRERIGVQISQELGSRVDPTALLAELSRVLPEGASLTELECGTTQVRRVSGPVTAGAVVTARRAAAQVQNETRMRLEITGVAPSDADVTTLIGRMTACPLLEEVSLVYTKNTTIEDNTRKARGFQITCLLTR